MTARIYQRAKNAMQSGKARTDEWVLEFVPSEARQADPLMGWTGSGDTQVQVQLSFADLATAKAYAAKNDIEYSVVEIPQKKLKLQAYADNFR
jgi:ETC complex I subunit conserved region